MNTLVPKEKQIQELKAFTRKMAGTYIGDMLEAAQGQIEQEIRSDVVPNLVEKMQYQEGVARDFHRQLAEVKERLKVRRRELSQVELQLEKARKARKSLTVNVNNTIESLKAVHATVAQEI